MKYILVVLSILLAGCVQTPPPPATSSVTDWQTFGEQTALKGKLKRDKTELAEQATSTDVQPDLYIAYDKGYEQGRAEYCSQNARALGRRGKPYLGICDELDKWFRFNYDRGSESKFDLR